MKYLVKATAPRKPKTKESQTIAIGYAVVLIVMVLCQLFTFDEFIRTIGGFGIAGGQATGQVLASLIVVFEVFALPFLLQIKTSPLMRIFSMVCGWAVAVVWLKLALWLVLTNPGISNVGFMGSVVKLIPGWWSVFLALALAIMAAWASWGMWPLERSKN